MKTLSFLLFAIVLALTAGQSHHTSFGRLENGDRLLHREIVREEYSWLMIVSKDFDYQTKNFGEIIHYIRVTDQYTNGNGGYASIYSGGPGSSSVKLHFKSQRSHGFNFVVEIFGR